MRTIITEFGELEIKEEDIISFDEGQGLYGFEDITEYVLIDHDENGIIMTLQTANGQVPQFIMLDPYAVIADFNPIVPDSDLKHFKVSSSSELKFLVVAIIRENYLESVVNLKSPIVINPVTRRAAQIILDNPNYSMKHKVFQENGGN